MRNYSLSGFRNALSLRYYYKYYWILDKRKDPDVVHIHFGDKAKFIANMKRDGFFANTKMIVTFHGYDLEPASLDRMKLEYQNIFREADLLTVNSQYSKDLLKKLDPQNRIEILPVGLDIKKFQKGLDDSSGKFQILFLGRLIGLKAPQVAIDILKMLLDRGHEHVRLTLIGEGELRAELEKDIKKRKLGDYIDLKGALSQEEIVAEFKKAAVLVMPGIYDTKGRAETQGLVIQEAQAVEIPVVVSDAGGMKYGMIDNKTGFVINQGDIKGFADKTEILILDENLRKEMGKNGRAYVEKKFDYRILGNRLEQLYFELLNLKNLDRNNSFRRT